MNFRFTTNNGRKMVTAKEDNTTKHLSVFNHIVMNIVIAKLLISLNYF